MSDSNLENGAKIAGAIPETLKMVDNICEKVGIYDLIKVIYGNKFHYLSEKQQLRFDNQLNNFKKELENSTSNIQEENLQEPKISIVGPALEASKYYFDEKEIREMFANLIASSMDSTYNGIVQHSFVEIIKQLSPYDAKLFQSLRDKEATVSREKRITSGFDILNECLFINNLFEDVILNEVSINNLERLGLVKLIKNQYLTDKNQYRKYNQYGEVISSEGDGKKKYTCKACILIITALGKAFKKVCLKDSL